MPRPDLQVFGAAEHNLQHIDVTIPRNAVTVITGLSGSGKSSLAFDTIYAEGQRRYIESLSAYARQFLDQMPKPEVEHISGLSPAISIEQKTVSRNPRSTVGTVTEIYDYLRLLFANAGAPHCPECGRTLESQSIEDAARQIAQLPKGTRLHILAPVVRGRKGEYQALFVQALKEGFVRAKIDGEIVELDPSLRLRRQNTHTISLVVDRYVSTGEPDARLIESLDKACRKADGLAIVEILPDRDGQVPKGLAWSGERMFSTKMACPEHGPQIVDLAPRNFSFNSPYGWCPVCKGLGTVPEVDLDALVPDPSLSIAEGAVVPWRRWFPRNPDTREPTWSWTYQMIHALAKGFRFKLTTPWRRLPAGAKETILNGSGARQLALPMPDRDGDITVCKAAWEGLVPRIHRKLHEAEDEKSREEAQQFVRDACCPACKGARLRPESLAVDLAGKDIASICAMDIGSAQRFFDGVRLRGRQEAAGRAPLAEIRDRLAFLMNVGLHYLTLDRHAGTLSGGEAQRIRLATQIGSQLRGVLYILDEPSIGLHQRDNERLIESLHRLRDIGNTVVIVEHDEQTIRLADHVVDLGPGAGRLGGRVLADGAPADLAKAEGSITGDYLAGRRSIATPAKRRPVDPDRVLRIRGASCNNLKDIDASFPLGLLIAVTGVSGSGKSSLVVETLVPALANAVNDTTRRTGPFRAIEGAELVDKVIEVDQSPIGRTPRSNPATYTKVFDAIRDAFAQTPEARMRGYDKGRFSFNKPGGRCEECGGDGVRRIEMSFLPDVEVLCEACGGKRYNRETLEVHYKGRTIADVLEMTVEEAAEFFSAVPPIANVMKCLVEVGLGYITLGQRATTFSGGEAQRIKLSRELAKRSTGRTFYILDEPTTGLHFEDVRKLIEVANKLVDAGNTVLIIEHNLDVVKCADYVVDLGPEGGAEGGRIIAEGTPEQVARAKDSETGRFLRGMLGIEAKPKARKGKTKP